MQFLTGSPSYPGLHVQLNEPGEFVQNAFSVQLLRLALSWHSFMSEKYNNINISSET